MVVMTAINSKRVVINVGGEVFETLEKTLSRYPETLLGDLNKRKKFYCSRSNQYFFNRHRLSFDAILFFYQSFGRLSRPVDVKLETFEEECKFFEIPMEKITKLKEREGFIDTENDCIKIEQWPRKIGHRIYYFLEYPESSDAAKIFAHFSFFMIFLSIVVSCFETLPQFRAQTDKISSFWTLSEFILNLYFLMELTMRFLLCPEKLVFFRSLLNWFDMVAILPYFLLLCFSNENVTLGFIRILRFSRVVRLLRVSKQSVRLQIVAGIVKTSAEDFQLLILCLMMLIIFGGSIMYYAESSSKQTLLINLPESFWWALQTTTTLGYGDVVPITIIGKLLASCYMAFGAMTMALSVLSIVTKFVVLYSANLKYHAQ